MPACLVNWVGVDGAEMRCAGIDVPLVSWRTVFRRWHGRLKPYTLRFEALMLEGRGCGVGSALMITQHDGRFWADHGMRVTNLVHIILSSRALPGKTTSR